LNIFNLFRTFNWVKVNSFCCFWMFFISDKVDQFHQHFTNSFYECRSQKCKKMLTTWLNCYAFMICARKSFALTCWWNRRLMYVNDGRGFDVTRTRSAITRLNHYNFFNENLANTYRKKFGICKQTNVFPSLVESTKCP